MLTCGPGESSSFIFSTHHLDVLGCGHELLWEGLQGAGYSNLWVGQGCQHATPTLRAKQN